MMAKLPRDVSGEMLVRGLERVGYERVRQRGAHLYLTTKLLGEHHVTVPLHNPLKPGTFAAILAGVCQHLDVDRPELLPRMKL